MLMVMRDGGVSGVSSRAKMEVGTENTGRWGGKRAKGMGDGGVAAGD
jgi:hypothetical protein